MRVPVVLFLLFCLIPSESFARVSKSSSRLIDPAYNSALAAANHFLHAWQTQDHEAGIMMLSDSAREHASAEHLQEFFSPGPDAAFEIRRGRRLNPGEYVFPAVLFGFSGTPSRPRTCIIVVLKSGKDDWSIDKLP